MALTLELQVFRRQIEAVRSDVTSLLADLTDAQLTTRPALKSWSITQCLAHLNATGAAYLTTIDPALAHAKSRGLSGPKSLRYGLLGGLFIRSTEPPVKMRLKSPKSFAPNEQNPDVVIADFFALQEGLLTRLEDSSGLDLGRLKVRSPALPLVRLNVYECFGMLLAHERRHVWQAQQVRTRVIRAAPTSLSAMTR